MVKKTGQITIKKIGNKYSACISGTPQELFDTLRGAEEAVEKMRKKYGRRHYKYKKNGRCRNAKKNGPLRKKG